jgi:hypothetical protein
VVVFSARGGNNEHIDHYTQVVIRPPDHPSDVGTIGALAVRWRMERVRPRQGCCLDIS